LICAGASIFVKDEEGISTLDFAKGTLNKLEDIEWMLSRMENETRARYLERKNNIKIIKKIVDMCEARIKSSKVIKKVLRKGTDRN
jgi:hypothetical protein